MDKEQAAIGMKIMEQIAPIAYKFIQANGIVPVMESLIWLASLIAAESDVPIEDFIHMARKCYRFNKAQNAPADGEQVH